MKNKKLYISICVFTMILSFFIIKNGIIGDKVTAIAEGEYVVEYFDGVELHSNNFQTRSATDGEQSITTQFKWRDDDGNDHPLSFTRITIIQGTNITNYYTDINGYLPSTCIVSTNEDFYLIVYAEGEKVSVKYEEGGDRLAWTYEFENFNLSSTQSIFIPTNSYVDFSKALQVSQALIFANKFAEEMTQQNISSVDAIFPADDSYHNRDSNTIRILGEIDINEENPDTDYFDWDVIMHEYGHHVSYEMGIIDSPGGYHNSSNNNADNRAVKSDGIGLAWGESWPTIFGELAQQYYSTYISSIQGVADSSYSDWMYDEIEFRVISYENLSTKKGEACEDSIMAILWDLFDTTNEDGDTISLSYQEWWDITTGYGATTFSDFINDFYTVYPEYIDDIASNLTKYQMAPKVGGDEYSLEIPRTISWTPQGGSWRFPNNSFTVNVYNASKTQSISINTTGTSVTLTNSQWNTILGWSGYFRYVNVVGYQTNSPSTGGYVSDYKEYSVFKTTQNGTGITITGSLVTLEDKLTIPETINNKTVMGIGDWAFQNQTLITAVAFDGEEHVTTIGTGAFNGCSLLNIFYIPSALDVLGDWALQGCDPNGIVLCYYGDCGLQTVGTGALSNILLLPLSNLPDRIMYIGAWAFSEVDFNDDLYLNTGNVRTIGEYAFSNCDISSALLSSLASSIGGYAFAGCSTLTIYTEHSSKPSGWASTWNPLNRPVIWNCTFDSTNSYVASINNTGNNITNGQNGFSHPCRDNYDFGGWYTTSDYSGTAYFDLTTAPTGTLYARWIKQESCVAEGTMVTLANGSQVAVENLTGNEELLVWNMNTGNFDSAPILFVDSDGQADREIIHLYFNDGTELKIVDEHALWCFDLNEYVYLDSDAEDYIGKYFNKKTANGYTAVQLIEVEKYREIVRTYSPVTSEHLCYYVNGLLSIPGGIGGMFNIFDVVATEMKYDQTAMQEDIATYGLFTYEEFCLDIAEISEETFNAFNGRYLKVSMGKGLINRDEILALIEEYQVFLI